MKKNTILPCKETWMYFMHILFTIIKSIGTNKHWVESGETEN